MYLCPPPPGACSSVAVTSQSADHLPLPYSPCSPWLLVRPFTSASRSCNSRRPTETTSVETRHFSRSSPSCRRRRCRRCRLRSRDGVTAPTDRLDPRVKSLPLKMYAAELICALMTVVRCARLLIDVGTSLSWSTHEPNVHRFAVDGFFH
jgi:hypothetical protein